MVKKKSTRVKPQCVATPLLEDAEDQEKIVDEPLRSIRLLKEQELRANAEIYIDALCEWFRRQEQLTGGLVCPKES
jgi:hypothetical protein